MVSLLCCCCSLTTATTLYYTPFLSFACFAVQLLLPNYYYSAFLYLLLCYVSISLFSGSIELLFSGYSCMLRVALRGRFETAEGLSIGQGRCLLYLCCKHIIGQNQLYSLITHVTRTPESKVFTINSFLLMPFLIYLIN